ncbi:MAG: hypothetical protein JWO25_3301 [Alphaproteobacteria bacterium]|nr:hypothetical protein [Alphaproteobacteria bacterium]
MAPPEGGAVGGCESWGRGPAGVAGIGDRGAQDDAARLEEGLETALAHYSPGKGAFRGCALQIAKARVRRALSQ